MRVIYQPTKAAAEYARLACNLYRGCGHRCTYCYAPGVLRMSREEFHAAPVLREGVLEKLERDAKELAVTGVDEPVLLSFTSDPYQPLDVEVKATRRAIEILNGHGIPVSVLTKGGLRSARDLDLLQKHPLNAYGVTLTLDNKVDSEAWEPGTASPAERIEVLRLAHEMGIRTWISCEPVVEPCQTLDVIRWAAPWADHIKVGKLNYHPRAAEIDWKRFHADAVDLLRSIGKPYTIKSDLRRAAA